MISPVGRSELVQPRQRGALPHLDTEMLEACRLAALRMGTNEVSSLGITSAIRGEGRTTVAMAMAAVQASDYQRPVVLIDLDSEGPTLASRLGAKATPGLTDVVRRQAVLEEVVQEIGDGLVFIAAGAVTGVAPRVIAEIADSGLVNQIATDLGFVVADLPPLLTTGTGAAAANLVRQTLLVVRAGVTPLARVREAVSTLRREPHVLLNDTSSSLPGWLRRGVGG